MSVDEISGLHQRYVALSDRFKAAWTFHQFLQGVKKLFDSEGLGERAVSFQGLYTELKTVSKNLHSTSVDEVGTRLEDIDTELKTKVGELIEEDHRISPSVMRQFFDRVKRYDDRILTQLLKFYIYNRKRGEWAPDQIDKADFLLTHLGNALLESTGEGEAPQHQRFRESLDGLWKAVDGPRPDEARVDDTLKELRTLHEAMRQIQSIEQFNHLGLVQGHRRLKHALGDFLFFPAITAEVVDNNLLLRRRIVEFYEREEQRIAAECQEVFELERDAVEVDDDLDVDLRSFRTEVEQLERHIASRNVKLRDLSRIRERARTLIPRLRDAGTSAAVERIRDHAEAGGHPVELPEASQELPNRRPTESLRIRTTNAEILADPLRRLLKLLETSDWQASPRSVTLTPEARPLRLEPREVLAYRRLHFPGRFDRELEQFLIESAALRLRINAEAEEIVGMIDLLDGSREAEVFERASATCRLASAFEQRFTHFVDQALLMGNLEEARSLQLHRMRLLRDYSGLWLLSYA